NLLSISGNNASRVFYLGSGGNATLSGMTIAGGLALGSGPGGSALGGAVDNEGTLTIDSSTLSGNQALGAPGGDAVSTFGFARGGAIYNSGVLTITNSCLEGNQAIGGDLLPGAPTGSLTESDGGAIASFNSLTISGSAFSYNQVIGGSGSLGGDSSE